MAKTIFILGAGASAHASVPVTKNFWGKAIDLIDGNHIDEKDLEDFNMIRSFFMNRIRLVPSNFNFDIENIETIFSLIEMAKLTNKFLDLSSKEIEKLHIAINKFIVRTIEKTSHFVVHANGNVISPKIYNNFYNYFIEGINNKENKFCVISFNYDLALDFVIEFHGGPRLINYCLPGQNRSHYDAIKLLKLHGSINWATCTNKNCNNIRVISIRDDIGIIGNPLRPIEASKIIKTLKCECGDKLNDLPLIVPPTWNKTGNYNIENVWHQTVIELSEAKNIFIIGYSMPKADIFFQYLLALGTLDIANLERFWVFDKNQDLEEKYSKLLGQNIRGKYRFSKASFEQAIHEIKEIF